MTAVSDRPDRFVGVDLHKFRSEKRGRGHLIAAFQLAWADAWVNCPK
jgi:hypothetical protein